MALRKVLDSDMQGKGNVGRNNPPGLSVAEMQRVLDELSREVIAPILNKNLDILAGTGGAGEIGTDDGQTVQDHLDATASGADLTSHLDDTNNPHRVTKAQVGLGNVDNTSDANKPVSTAQAAALAQKADTTTVNAALAQKADKTTLNAHTGNTKNPHQVTKAQVGLGNVDNTSDANKPVSTAQAAALAQKADTTTVNAALAQKADQTALDALEGEVDGKADTSAVTAALAGKVDKETGKGLSSNDYTTAEKEKVAVIDTSGTGNRYLANDGTYKAVQGGGGTGGVTDYEDLSSLPQINGNTLIGNKTSAELGLQPAGNYATAEALAAHTGNTQNPHQVTKVQVGLGNVDNTSDANKPVSTAQQQALNAKANQTDLDALETTVAGKAAKAVAISASLTVEGWTGDAAPYTQTIAAAGVTADTSQVVEVGGAENLTAEQYEAMVAAQLWAKSKAEGTVTIEAKGEKPAVALPVVVVIYG